MCLYPAEEPLQPWQDPVHINTQTLLIFNQSITAALDVLIIGNDQ